MVHLDQEDQMHCLKTLKLISFYGQRGSKIFKYRISPIWVCLRYFVLTKKLLLLQKVIIDHLHKREKEIIISVHAKKLKNKGQGYMDCRVIFMPQHGI